MAKQKQHKKVYIEGLIMPENCDKCPFCDLEGNDYKCRLDGHIVQNMLKREYCKLKEGAF